MVNPFVDIATFFESSFNSFLFYVTSLVIKICLFFTKLAISLFLAKFARFNHKSKISAINLLNSEVVIYLS